MVQIREASHIHADGTVNLATWLRNITPEFSEADMQLIRHACSLAQITGEECPTFCGESCLQQGLAMAEILHELGMDKESLAAALVYPSSQYSDLSLDDIREHLGEKIAHLVEGVGQMDAVRALYHRGTEHPDNRLRVDNLRKMLLAMVSDVRVVVIKLTERTCVLRGVRHLPVEDQHLYAKEITDIYAPLANRLGISQIKWEMEDLSFRYLQGDVYKDIAKRLQARRVDRERYVEEVINRIESGLKEAHIDGAEVYGRAKHIFSIYRKMQRKSIDYDQIYDAIAVRVLLNTVEECYAVLGIVHGLWEHFPDEFDDYIQSPKSNGYRSIHTAVKGPNGKYFEVQIRTREMHEESELGVAAHWMYKEGGKQKTGYENKIAWLRQVLDWERELASQDSEANKDIESAVFEDRIYVFTPAGDIVDLPNPSTPLDFAYYIHSEVGHRCRGAKVNGHIVPLTYCLNTGEQIEVLTGREISPSRDWLNQNLGYLHTSRAKAKVHHWFRLQDYDHNLAEGRALLDKELKRLHLAHPNYNEIAQRFNYQSGDDLLAALGSGDMRLVPLLHAIQSHFDDTITSERDPLEKITTSSKHAKETGTRDEIHIQGVGNLLTFFARCCKPVPGDKIVGYITQGRGVAIHRGDCSNITGADEWRRARLIEVEWGTETKKSYPVDIFIRASDRPELIRDIAAVLANDWVSISEIRTQQNPKAGYVDIHMTIELGSVVTLSRILERINQLPDIIEVRREHAD